MNKTTVWVGLALPFLLGLGMVLALLLVFEPEAASQSCGGGSSVGPSTAAGIPQALMPYYDGAAGKYQLGPDGWAYLAAINNVESSFGQNISTSSAGAVGWMQFEPSTWAQYGVTPSGAKAPYGAAGWDDPADAIYSAANYLQASGAPGNWSAAIYVYNHAGWYVSQVEGIAAGYIATAAKAAGPGIGGIGTGLSSSATTSGASTGGQGAGAGAAAGATAGTTGGQGTATTAPGDTGGSAGCGVVGETVPGDTAKILANGTAAAPANAPLQVQLAIAAGNRIIDTFYSQERRANMLTQVQDSYDCSGSTDFVLYNSQLGNTPLVDVGNGVAGDSSLLEQYGQQGKGQWITVYGSTNHAFIEVAGILLDTSYNGTSVNPSSVPDSFPADDPTNGGPNSGPRWIPASYLPTQLADGNVWSIRHPPGL